MLPMGTMTPKGAIKKTSAAASKIKNKILNTSSFFKVSLKINNRALALALEAQKEKNRQQEKEVVFFQKQVEALCFELASMKYKHRKLLLILENLRSNTLQHFHMVAELFTDNDLKKLPEDDVNNSNPEEEKIGPTDQVPSQPEPSGADVPSIPRYPTDASAGNTDAEERLVRSPQRGTFLPSSTLRDDVERLSVMLFQPGFESNSILCLQNSQPPSAVKKCENPTPSLSDDDYPPKSPVAETEPGGNNKKENTVLLNSTMETTEVHDTDIVTVETKVKKAAHSGKKSEDQASELSENPQLWNCVHSRLSEVQRSSASTSLWADDHAPEDTTVPEVIELQSTKTSPLSGITSRIPKLRKFEAGNHQKKTKVRSHDQAKSHSESCENASQQLDDYFKDGRMASSKDAENVELLAEKDLGDEVPSRITCRRSRTKGRGLSSVSRKTLVTLPLRSHEGESCQFEMEEKHVSNKPHKTNSRASPKFRCRGTFVVSVKEDGNSSYTPGEGEQDLIPSTESFTHEAEEPKTVSISTLGQQHPESDLQPLVKDTQSSIQRPRNHQKRTKAKSHDQTESLSEFVDAISQDFDDYFSDGIITSSNDAESFKFLPEKDSEEEDPPRITCRRSRTKGRMKPSVSRKTLVTLPLRLIEGENFRSEMDEEHVSNKRQKTNSGASHKSRSRGTFFVSVTEDGTSPSTPGEGGPDLIPSTESFTNEAEELKTISISTFSQQHPESNLQPLVKDTQSSSKRPWHASQDSGGHEVDLSSNNECERAPSHQDSASATIFPKPKKARKEERSRSSKKKAGQRDGEAVDLNSRRTKKTKAHRGLVPEGEAHCVGDSSDGKEHLKEVVESHSCFREKGDIFEHVFSKHSSMELNPDRHSNSSHPHPQPEPRRLRETFVAYRRKTEDKISLRNTRTSDESCTSSHMMDMSDRPVGENEGHLLMDEMPPWSALDTTEMDSELATPKRLTSTVTAKDLAGRVLTSLTNIIATPDRENRGRTRRGNGGVSYKEPALNSKMRRGDKFTESTFLSAPVFKDGRKKKQKTVPKAKPLSEDLQ